MAALHLVFIIFSTTFLSQAYSLEPSQYLTMVRIKHQLNFPLELTNWSDDNDLCNSTTPSPILSLACYQDDITQLHFAGNGFKLDQRPDPFALFSNIAALPNLKVLSLVSMGLGGPLPANIGDLHYLEILNISSNAFNGSIPLQISSLKSLQTLILDHNSFTGQIPEWISSLPELSVLSLRNNSFIGSIPTTLPAMGSLRTLVLSQNNLSGQLDGIKNLNNLQVVQLEDNSFGPQFPPALPHKLVSLVLRNNRFHSAVESGAFNSCFQLQNLDISMNDLVGVLPTSLLTLPSLTHLNIGGNKFTGKLLNNMSCTQLRLVNLTNNRLTGNLPDCLRNKSKVVLYRGNCLWTSYQHQHPPSFCHDEALAVKVSPKKRSRAVVASTIAGAAMIIGLAVLLARTEFGKQRKNLRLAVEKVLLPQANNTFQLLKDAKYISETVKIAKGGTPAYRTFGLEELREATDNFSPKNLATRHPEITEYKGRLKDGTVVSIRPLKSKTSTDANVRKGVHLYNTNQLEIIAKLRHQHIVTSLGHCHCHCSDDGGSSLFLVFEYIEGTTLREFLSENRVCWAQRITAAIGVTKGIRFLHTGIVPGVYSNHLKIINILLDHDYHIKICRYNIPLLTMDQMRSSPSDNGKSDIYDFGVILLEIIVGKMINSTDDLQLSKNLIEKSLSADPTTRRQIMNQAVVEECNSDDSLITMLKLCMNCLSTDPSQRPSVEDILWNLHFAAQVQDSWNNPSSISNQSSPKPDLANSSNTTKPQLR